MSSSVTSRLARWSPGTAALALLTAGCIEPLSVGVSPLATVDARITVARDASVGDAEARDAAVRLDSGARPAEAGAGQTNDGALADAAVRDAGATDAASSDAASRDAAVDAGKPDAGFERCEEALCAIAGISPRDTSCPDGQVSACLREESGQCWWYCL